MTLKEKVNNLKQKLETQEFGVESFGVENKQLKEDVKISEKVRQRWVDKAITRQGEINNLKQKLDEKDTELESLQLHYDSMFGINQDLQQKLEQIKKWYGRTQGQVTTESALEMIEILKEKT